MYFSKVEINPSPSSYKQWNMLSPDLYGAHQLLWQLFPGDQDADRDFLFRQEIKKHIPYYYLLSRRKPESSLDFLSIQTKEYDPVIRDGSSFSFKLRINPVISKAAPERKNSAKHDIYMNFKMEGRQQGLRNEDLKRFINKEIMEWIERKSVSFGFSLEPGTVVISRYMTNWFRKKRGGRPIRFSSLDFEGILSVSDSGRFSRTLFDGVGRAKAFGCGLMMIRRR